MFLEVYIDAMSINIKLVFREIFWRKATTYSLDLGTIYTLL